MARYMLYIKVSSLKIKYSPVRTFSKYAITWHVMRDFETGLLKNKTEKLKPLIL